MISLLMHFPVYIIAIIYCISTFIPDRLLVYDGDPARLEVLRNDSFEGVFLISAEVVAAYNKKHRKSGIISLSKERVFLIPLSIIFKMNSCLEPEFDYQVSKFTGNGLIHLWGRIFIDNKFLREPKTKKDTRDRLSIQQIMGVVVILCVMCTLSFLVFCLELLTLKLKCVRLIFDVLL